MTICVPSDCALREIRELAEKFHNDLVAEFGAGPFGKGGNLFMGCYYAQSDRIYFGLNLGSKGEQPFETHLKGDCNPPFHIGAEERGVSPASDNWKAFLDEHHDLRRWFHLPITNAFLIPWRSEDFGKLNGLNRLTHGKLYACSGSLTRQMIEHHQARLLLVTGKIALQLLASKPFLSFPWRSYVEDEHYFGSHHQWRKLRWVGEVNRKSFDLTILQIPSFSYPRVGHHLLRLADWLRANLEPFGF